MSRNKAVPITEELTSVIIIVIAQNQKLITYGELICSLSPIGREPVEKAKRVKAKIAVKSLLHRRWFHERVFDKFLWWNGE